jgi:hypothetical protein
MIRRCRLAVLLFIGLVLVTGGGCATSGGKEMPKGATGPLAEVDRVEAPDRIASADTLAVRLVGTVGPNGCYALDRVAVARVGARIRLTPLIDPSRRADAMCTMAIVPLDETVRLAPPFEPGPLTILVPQSAGAAVRATVDVIDSNK